MRFARISAGCVAEIVTLPDGVVPEGVFIEELAGQFVTCATPAVGEGWRYENDSFLPPVVVAEPDPDLAEYAARRRYAVETGGIVLNSAHIDTSAASQAKIGNAYLLLQASGSLSVEFKAQNGFVTLSAAQFKDLALAVGQHVQACYAKESEILSGITAKKPTIKTLADVDAAFASLAA